MLLSPLCCRGLMPADADYNLLDVARRLEMYGMTLYPAKVGSWFTIHCKNFTFEISQSALKL